MYDLAFVFEGCGFEHIPKYIERERLFNVSFDINTGEIKLYVLDQSERFLYKLSHRGITRQYSGDDCQYGGDIGRLMRHLDCPINEREIVIDAVEGDTYYIYIDDASPEQCLLLIDAVCRTCSVTQAQFLRAINAVNARSFASVREGLAHKAISLIRIPLLEGDLKVYSRPFHSGNGFELNPRTRSFLSRLYHCTESALPQYLEYMWAAKDLKSERMLVVTQRHELLHGE